MHRVISLHLFSVVSFAPCQITAHILNFMAQTRKRKYFYHVFNIEMTVVVLVEPATLKYIGTQIFQTAEWGSANLTGLVQREHLGALTLHC